MRPLCCFLVFLLVSQACHVSCIAPPSTSHSIASLSFLQRRNSNIALESCKTDVVIRRQYASAFGVLSVVTLLGNAIARLVPIATFPLLSSITRTQSIVYALFVAFMLYVQGYKAFHLKFSPLVVARAAHLPSEPFLYRTLLAGPYCMGLVRATNKRMIISWSTSIGVTLLIVLVKYLPYPWRSIVDGGAVAGLTVGTLSILWHYLLFYIYLD